MSSSNKELLDALKIAFCYMPELEDLTIKDYAGIEELEETSGQGSFVITYLVYQSDHQPLINASA